MDRNGTFVYPPALRLSRALFRASIPYPTRLGAGGVNDP